jgi:predicted Zn-dependent protease
MRLSKLISAQVLVLVVSIAALVGCSSLSTPDGHVVTVSHDAQITEATGESKTLNRNQTASVTDQPVFIESPGRVSVLILPPNENKQKIDLKLKKISEFGGREFEQYADSVLNEIMNDVYQVQVRLGAKQYDIALTKVKELRGKHPFLSFLMLLEASCHLGNGNRESAIAVLREALSKNPSHREASDLLLRLTSDGRLPTSLPSATPNSNGEGAKNE